MSDLGENEIIVSFGGGAALYPAPIVNYTYQPIEFGYVHGYVTEITLDGMLLNATPEDAQNFANSFPQFTTLNAAGIVWQNVIVNSITFDQSQYFKDPLGTTFTKYKIKCTSYGDLPNGIIDPSYEISFSENDDGTVNVTKKISARGVSSTSNGQGFENAKSFVQGIDTSTATFGTLLVPSAEGVLISFSENSNRPEGVYSITKTYKYNTQNPNNVCVRYSSFDIEDNIGLEYKIASYNLKLVGSPIEGSLSELYSQIGNLKNDISNEAGIPLDQLVQHTYSANTDEGSKTIDIKAGFLIGANLNGFLDYVVSYEKDLILNTEIWKIDGEFKCYGPLSYRNSQLELFKNNAASDGWKTYLQGLITSSPIYSSFHDPTFTYISPNVSININEVKDMASLQLSMTLNVIYEPEGVTELKYTINGSPSKRIYELLPSATVEGNYIIQDLQTKTSTVVDVSVTAKTPDKNVGLVQVNGYLTNFKNSLGIGEDGGGTSFITEESLGTATFDVSASKKFIGKTNIDSVLTNLNAVGSINSATLRQQGFNFGF